MEMALALRIIRKSRWYLKPAWLSPDDLQADALADLGTKNNKLFLWYIYDNRSNLDRIIAALAAKRDVISNFDFILFDQIILKKNSIKFIKTKGISLDEEANELWHFDLYELSASSILKLALSLAKKGELNRIPERKIKDYLTKAIIEGTISYEQLSKNIKLKL